MNKTREALTEMLSTVLSSNYKRASVAQDLAKIIADSFDQDNLLEAEKKTTSKQSKELAKIRKENEELLKMNQEYMIKIKALQSGFDQREDTIRSQSDRIKRQDAQILKDHTKMNQLEHELQKLKPQNA